MQSCLHGLVSNQNPECSGVIRNYRRFLNWEKWPIQSHVGMESEGTQGYSQPFHPTECPSCSPLPLISLVSVPFPSSPPIWFKLGCADLLQRPLISPFTTPLIPFFPKPSGFCLGVFFWGGGVVLFFLKSQSHLAIAPFKTLAPEQGAVLLLGMPSSLDQTPGRNSASPALRGSATIPTLFLASSANQNKLLHLCTSVFLL
jgi:hypothetical protein